MYIQNIYNYEKANNDSDNNVEKLIIVFTK